MRANYSLTVLVFFSGIVEFFHLVSVSLYLPFLAMYCLFGPPAVAGRSYELGPVLPPSCRPSFLGICSLVFSETQHGVRGPCGVVRDRAGILGKNIFAPKMRKIGQKWAKNRVF